MDEFDKLYVELRDNYAKTQHGRTRSYLERVWQEIQRSLVNDLPSHDRGVLLIATVYHESMHHIDRNERGALAAAKVSANAPKIIALGYTHAQVSEAMTCCREFQPERPQNPTTYLSKLFARAVKAVVKEAENKKVHSQWKN